MLTQLRSNRRWNGRRRTSRSAASSRLSRVARISRRTAPIRNVSRNQFCCVIYFYPLSPKKSDLQRGSLRLHESKHSLAEKNNKQCTVPRFPSVCARLPIHSFQQNSTTCKWSFNPLMLLLGFFFIWNRTSFCLCVFFSYFIGPDFDFGFLVDVVGLFQPQWWHHPKVIRQALVSVFLIPFSKHSTLQAISFFWNFFGRFNWVALKWTLLSLN